MSTHNHDPLWQQGFTAHAAGHPRQTSWHEFDGTAQRWLAGWDAAALHQNTVVNDLIRLADLTLRFARVDRATRHPDGKRPETDSDHTVMLSVVVCAFAAKVAPRLDLGRIAQFATIHDLVEAHAGDVMSLGMLPWTATQKALREAAALNRIIADFTDLPWVWETILEYESLRSEEARFVKIVDKVLPKLTHLLNGGAALREHGFTFEQAHRDHLTQRATMAAKYPQVEALALFDAVIERCAQTWGVSRG